MQIFILLFFICLLCCTVVFFVYLIFYLKSCTYYFLYTDYDHYCIWFSVIIFLCDYFILICFNGFYNIPTFFSLISLYSQSDDKLLYDEVYGTIVYGLDFFFKFISIYYNSCLILEDYCTQKYSTIIILNFQKRRLPYI